MCYYAITTAKELSTTPTDDLESLVKVGDELDLVVISRIGNDKENGSYLLSKRRLDAKKLWEEIEAKYAAGEVVDATITNVVKGGLVADLGIRAFIPASMVDRQISAISSTRSPRRSISRPTASFWAVTTWVR